MYPNQAKFRRLQWLVYCVGVCSINRVVCLTIFALAGNHQSALLRSMDSTQDAQPSLSAPATGVPTCMSGPKELSSISSKSSTSDSPAAPATPDFTCAQKMNGSVYEDSDSSSDAASLSPRPQLNEPQRVSGCVLVYGQVSVLKRPTNICQKRVNEETKVEAQQGTFFIYSQQGTFYEDLLLLFVCGIASCQCWIYTKL